MHAKCCAKVRDARKLDTVRIVPPLLALIAWAGLPLQGQPAPAALTLAQAQTLVERALATESQAAQELSHAAHPMRYRLHKTSPRLSSTKEIVETRDGDVARLLARSTAIR